MAHLGRLVVARKALAVSADDFACISAALVATQTFRVLASQLTDAATRLGPPSSSQPCLPRDAAGTLAVLNETLTLLEVLTSAVDCERRPDEKRTSHSIKVWRELRQLHVMELWARAVLLLVCRCRGDGAVQDQVAGLLPRVAGLLQDTYLKKPSVLVHEDYSLSYLMTSHLVGLAAALDGRTTYGMPAGVHVAAPLADTAGRRLQLRAGELVVTRFAQWALEEWRSCIWGMAAFLRQPDEPPGDGSIRQLAARRLARLTATLNGLSSEDKQKDDYWQMYWDTAAGLEFVRELLQASKLRVPPFKVAATWDVSMRLADAAVAVLTEVPPPAATAAGAPEAGAASAGAAAPAPAPLPEQQQHPRPRVPPDQAASLGLNALQCARAALWDVGWATEAEHPLAKLQQLQRWWDLAARFVRAAPAPQPGSSAEGGGSWKWASVGKLLPLRVHERAIAPAAPAADVAAALRAGYPQLLESLMRQWPETLGGGACQGPAPLSDISADAWAQLLTFADPRVTAALAATAAKVARRTTVRVDGITVAMHFEMAALGLDADPFAILPDSRLVQDNVRLRAVHSVLDDTQAHARVVFEFVRHVLSPLQESGTFLDRIRPHMAAAAAGVAATSEPGTRRCDGGGGSSGDGGGNSGDDAGRGESEGPGAPCGGDSADRGGAGGTSRSSNGGDGVGSGAAVSGLGGLDRNASSCVHVQLPVCRQMAVALSHIAVHVLPVVTLLALSRAPTWGMVWGTSDQHALAAALSWVPVLAAAAAPATQAAAPAEWERFLWSDVRLPRLLGCGLRMMEVLAACQFRGSGLRKAWLAAMWALVRLAPGRLAEVLLATPAPGPGRGALVGAATVAEAAACAAKLAVEVTAFDLARLRRALGPGGEMPDPQLLAALERACTAGCTERHVTDPSSPVCTGADAAEPLPEDLRQWGAAAALLVPPAEVRAALPTCDNPGCTNLEGDSEAGLRLAGCERCGGRVRYCSKKCQRRTGGRGTRRSARGCGNGRDPSAFTATRGASGCVQERGLRIRVAHQAGFGDGNAMGSIRFPCTVDYLLTLGLIPLMGLVG